MHISRDNQIISACIQTLSQNQKPRSARGYSIIDWVEDNFDDIEFEGSYNRFPGSKSNRKHVRTDWPKALKRIQDNLQDQSSATQDYVDQNARVLSEALGCDRAGDRIIAIALRMAINSEFDSFCDGLVEDFKLEPVKALSLLTGLEETLILDTLKPDSPLGQSGLFIFQSHEYRRGSYSEYWFRLNPLIKSILRRPVFSTQDILESLSKIAPTPETTLKDFTHKETVIAICQKLLMNVRKAPQAGINILIYGEPGTGKTELARALSAHLNMTLHQIAEDINAKEPSRQDRLNALKFCQTLSPPKSNHLFLFDEMEDLDNNNSFFSRRQTVSKVFMNRLLENNPVPVIWISNDTDCFDKAFLRRFTFSFEMKKPPQSVRQSIWYRLYDKYELDIPKSDLAPLITRYDQPPAFIDTAFKALSIMQGDIDDLEHMLKNQCRLSNHKPKAANQNTGFEPNLIETIANLDQLTHKITKAPGKNISLCISGPPGTGKSAYGRFLAQEMDLPVIQKRASDMLGMYVGQSEKNIARAFEEAADMGAFLIFDEADSLLSNRELAQRSWEVSQVNEMLTQMETHPYPFLATTNLRNRLDPASTRRFTFKLTFQFLNTEKLTRTYVHFFGERPSHALSSLINLTPGDFHVVKKRCDILGLFAPSDIFAELNSESQAKQPDRPTIGFNRGSFG